MSSSSRSPAARGASAGGRWQSPIGPLEIVASERGLRQVAFVLISPPPLLPLREKRSGDEGCHADRDGKSDAQAQQTADSLVAQAIRELQEYFDGRRRHFDIPLDLAGAPFQMAVWQSVLEIPFGETITYRQLAAAAGRPAAIRAAGAANGANPLAIVVPCHRVLGTNGALTGYSGGLEAKRFLLDLERTER